MARLGRPGGCGPQPPAWPPLRRRRTRLRRAGPGLGASSRPAGVAGSGPGAGAASGRGRWPVPPGGGGCGRWPVPGGACGAGWAWPFRFPPPARGPAASPRPRPRCHGPGASPPPLRPRAGGGAGAGAARGRAAGRCASLARASSSCWGSGFDTSLTRIAVLSVTFIPGIVASTDQCRTAGRRLHLPARPATGTATRQGHELRPEYSGAAGAGLVAFDGGPGKVRRLPGVGWAPVTWAKCGHE